MLSNGLLLMDRLVIIDPLNNQNNVGRCTFNINEIKVLFLLIKQQSFYFRKLFWSPYQFYMKIIHVLEKLILII